MELSRTPRNSHLFLIIFAIITICLAVFLGLENKAPAEDVNKINASGWQIYKEQAYKFEIQFPKDWQVETLPQGIVLKSPLSGSKLEVLKTNDEEGLALDEWFRKFTIVGGRPTVKAMAKPTMLNGRRAYKLDSGLEPPNPLFEVYIADDQRRIFVLSATSANSTNTTILYTILSTFRFIQY